MGSEIKSTMASSKTKLPSLSSLRIIFALLFLMKITLVSSVTEEDYNSADYEQESQMSSGDEKWAEIPEYQPSARLEAPVMKRHLGSLAASSGFSIHEDGFGNGIKSGFRFVGMPGSKKSRFIPPMARNYLGSRFYNMKRDLAGSTEISENGNDQEKFYDQPISFLNGDNEDNSLQSLKVKRFMGSLARGGWFPRQFRGLVAEPQWDKRHVGAVARLGWMPHSKNLNARPGTEWNFKRNIGSLRKNQMAPNY